MHKKYSWNLSICAWEFKKGCEPDEYLKNCIRIKMTFIK